MLADKISDDSQSEVKHLQASNRVFNQQFDNFYVVKNQKNSSKDRKNHTFTEKFYSSEKCKPSRSQHWRLGTACTVYASNICSSSQTLFTHPWAMTVKSRSIRIKTDFNKHHSTSQFIQRVNNDIENNLKNQPIHSKKHNSCNSKYINQYNPQKFNGRIINRINKKYLKHKNDIFLKRIKQQKQSRKHSIQNAIQMITHRQASQKYNREILKQKIISQRNQKQKAIQRIQKQKANIAFQQRMLSYELKSERRQIQDYDIYQKRLINIKQKQRQFDYKLSKNKIKIQYQKKQTKIKLHKKWINQFQNAYQNEGLYSTPRQQQFAVKMQKAINILANLTQ